MKLISLALMGLFSVSTFAQVDTVFHEIPVSIYKTKAPFSDGMGVAFAQRNDYDGRYEREFHSLPKGWTSEETYVAHQILDFNQHVHQKHLLGEFNDSMFQFMAEEFPSLTFDDVVDREVACMMYIAYRHKESCIEFVLDANANLDFSDDDVHTTCAPNRHLDPEAQSKNIELDYKYEYVLNGEVFTDSLTVAVRADSAQVGPNVTLLGLFNKTLGYGVFHFEGDTVYVRSGIANNELSKYASLYVVPNLSYSQNSYMADYVELNGRTLQFTDVLNNPARIQLRELVEGEKPKSSKVGFYLPSFGGVNVINGDSVHTDDYLGKYLYIDVWGSWCAGCVIDLPNLVNTYAELDKSEIEVLGVAYDVPQNLQGAIDKYGITYANILSSSSNGITSLLNIKSYPSTILINPEGKVIARGLRGENLLELIQEAIEKDKSEQ